MKRPNPKYTFATIVLIAFCALAYLFALNGRYQHRYGNKYLDNWTGTLKMMPYKN